MLGVIMRVVWSLLPLQLLATLGAACLKAARRPVHLLAVVALVATLGCADREPGAVVATTAADQAAPAAGTSPSGPMVVVVGTVQDGGLPHAGCSCRRCEVARSDPARRRHVASLALVLPASDQVYLLDATPDLPAQLAMLRPYRPHRPEGRVDRTPVSGVLLTHAHMGHYLGLAHFGFEVMHSQALPLYATPRMAAFLRTNGPWDQLVRLGNVELMETPPGATYELAGGVQVTPLAVPHRDEYSDTVAYRLAGPSRTLLYVPDTDGWELWQPPLDEVLAGIDVALLDGTFYSSDELPGRAVRSIGHPLITTTMERLGPRVHSGELEVFFTHLNHSNPALEPGSAAQRAIEAAGFAVLAEGQQLPL